MAVLTEEEADALLKTAPPPLVNENPPEPITEVTPQNVDQLFGQAKTATPNKPSLIGDIARGIDNLQSTGGGLVELLGNATDIKGMEEWGHAVRSLNDAEAEMNPAAVGTYKNIHGPGSLLRYATEAILENAPLFLPSVITGGMGGIIGRVSAETLVKNMAATMTEEQVAKLVAKRVMIGSTLGAYASSAAQEAGDIYGDTVQETGQHNPGYAIGAGLAAGVFDALPEGKLITNVLGAKLAGQLEKRLVTRMGVEGTKQFLMEAPTEAIQTIIEQTAITHADPKQELFSSDRVDQYIDAFAKGGFAGGIMGAGGEVLGSALRAHPDDLTRQKEKDITNQANAQSTIPTAPAEVVTEEDKRIAEIHQQVDELDKKIADPAIAQADKDAAELQKTALLAEADKLANPPAATATATPAPAATTAAPTATATPAAAPAAATVPTQAGTGNNEASIQKNINDARMMNPGNDQGAIAFLRKYGDTAKAQGKDEAAANYHAAADIMEKYAPTYQFPKETNLPEGVTGAAVDETRDKVHATVDSLVNEKDQAANPTEAAHYTESVKQAIEPHLNFLTGEGVKIVKAPRGESYGVVAKPNGDIHLWVPSFKEWMARNARERKKGGLVDTNALHSPLADHEVIHAALYTYLRDKWKKGGSRGDFGGQDGYVHRNIKKIGDALIKSSKDLPEILGRIYQPTHGPTDSFTTGTEILRMMAERARTGKLSEDAAIAENIKDRGTTTPFLKALLDAAQLIRDSIKKFLDPATSPKIIQDVYNGLNAVLDKYGNIQPKRVPPVEDNSIPMRVSQARELGSLVNENPPAVEPPVPITPEEKQARVEQSQERQAEKAAERRGLTPEVRASYVPALEAARQDPDKIPQAAKLHAQMQLAKGNNLATGGSLEAARQDFETNLQRPVSSGTYNAAVEAARAEPLPYPASRRNLETNETDQTRSTDETGDANLDRPADASLEARPDTLGRAERPDGTELNRRLDQALAEKDFGEVSEALLGSGSSELYHQFFTEVMNQAEANPSAEPLRPAAPIRGQIVAQQLLTKPHDFASGKRDQAFRGDDDWFARNVWGMEYVVPSRWRDQMATGIPLIDWGGDFAESPQFQKHANLGASMTSPKTISDKLKEANATEGTAKTFPISRFDTSDITQSTLDKLDREFGENQWIVKPINDSMSRNVFFPNTLRKLVDLNHSFKALMGSLMVQQRFEPMPIESGFLANAPSMDKVINSMARVHIVTDEAGKVHVVPFATIDYSKAPSFADEKSAYEHIVYQTPTIYADERIKGFENAARVAIESLPADDRSGSMYSVEVVQTPTGFGIIELNPNFSQYAENGRGGGGHLQNNYAVQDAVISAMKGELPLHARIAEAMREAGPVSRRSPEIQELEGQAKASLDKMFNPNVLVNETQRKFEVGSRLKFGGFTSMEMEMMSQPKEPSFFMAKAFFDQTGSVMDNAEYLLRNNEVQGSGLSGAERTAYYKIVMIGLDHMRTEYWENPENFVAEEGDVINDTLEQIDAQYGLFGVEVGRIASSMKDLAPFINGRKTAKEYAKAIITEWKRRFGKTGMDYLGEITAKMNKISANAVAGIVTRAESVAFFRRVLNDLNSKEWRKAMRKTLVNESEKMRGIARRVASRAAEMSFGNLENEPALKEAARRILNDISFGLPKEAASDEEKATIFSQAVSEVARGTARQVGAIPESTKAEKVTESQKLGEILKSPELYNRFVMNIEERLRAKFGAKGGPVIAESIQRFTENMRQRTWMEGLLEKIVHEKTAEIGTSVEKIARMTYGEGKEGVDIIKNSIIDELKSHGLSDEVLTGIQDDLDSTLNDSVEKAREVWAGTPGAVRKTLKEIGQTVNKVARQGFLSRDQTAQRLSKAFIEQLGLANTPNFPHAQRLEEIIQKQLAELVTAERKSIIDSITRNADPTVRAAAALRGARDRRTTIEKIIEMANVGALTDEKVYGALADKLGLPKYSQADSQHIQDWGQRIGDMPDNREKLNEIVKLRDYIESRKGLSWKQMLVAGMYASMLSGPSTHAVNAVSNMLNLMGEVFTQSVLHPSRTPAILRAMLIGLTRGGMLELRETIATGIGRKLNQKVEGGNPLEHVDPVYLDRGAEAIGNVLSLTRAKYVVRFLQGVDMMFYKAAQEVSFAGKTGYNGSGDNWAAHVTQATRQMQAEGRNVTSRAGMRAVELRAMENMEAARIANNPELERAWMETHQEALNTTFNQEPKGWLGRFALMVAKYTAEYPAAKLLVPFTKVVANVLNAQIDWSPFGLARWAFSKDFKIQDAEGRMVRDPQILVRSLTSMVALSALAAMLAKYDDEDDPYFTIYGSGPKDANKKRQLYERGWKPFTMKVGDAYISYLPTPMSLSFSALGTVMDRHREGGQIDMTHTMPQLGLAFIQGTLNQSFLSGVADLFSAFQSADPESKVERFIARTATTFVVPNLLKQVSDYFDPSVQEASGIGQEILKQIPVARHLLNPMLNVFGEEVSRTGGPWNVPFSNRFITMAKTDDPVFSFLGDNALSVPSYSKQTKLGNDTMTEDQYYMYVQKAGPKIYQAIKREIPNMRNLDRESQQERVDKIAQRIKAETRQELRATLSLTRGPRKKSLTKT
jgi:hypothetical protein